MDHRAWMKHSPLALSASSLALMTLMGACKTLSLGVEVHSLLCDFEVCDNHQPRIHVVDCVVQNSPPEMSRRVLRIGFHFQIEIRLLAQACCCKDLHHLDMFAGCRNMQREFCGAPILPYSGNSDSASDLRPVWAPQET